MGFLKTLVTVLFRIMQASLALAGISVGTVITVSAIQTLAGHKNRKYSQPKRRDDR